MNSSLETILYLPSHFFKLGNRKNSLAPNHHISPQRLQLFAPLNVFSGNFFSSWPNAVACSSSHRWVVPISWDNIFHWLFFPSKIVSLNYSACTAKNWHPPSPSSPPVCPVKPVFRMLFDLPCVVVNLCIICGYQMTQKLVQIAVDLSYNFPYPSNIMWYSYGFYELAHFHSRIDQYWNIDFFNVRRHSCLYDHNKIHYHDGASPGYLSNLFSVWMKFIITRNTLFNIFLIVL